jgi:ABC-type nickel/cobalt efflux system permease component RcnA/ABC-type uncharacterized transport system substrate-binding protein
VDPNYYLMHNLSYLLKNICFLLYIISPSLLFAHPHVFVDCELTVVFDEKGLAGFHNHWTLDRMFSGNILSSFAPDYDPDQLTLSKADQIKIKKGAFDHLKKSNYFNHIFIENHEIDALDAQDFNAEATSKGLVYKFFIPFYLSADHQLTSVKMSVYDTSFYSSVQISSILISESDSLDITHTIGKMDEFTYYMGQVKQKGIAVHFKTTYESSMPTQIVLENETDTFSPSDHQKSQDKARNTLFQELLNGINRWQKFLKNSMTSYGNHIKQDYWSFSLLMFLVFSFVYGVIHALGPGHGKTVVSSFFISRQGSYKLAILMAFALSVIHAMSGAIFVVFFKLVLESSSIFSNVIPVERVSYALLIIIGLFLFIHAFIDIKKNEQKPNQSSSTSLKQIFFIAFVTGMIPCPGAAIILIFSLSLDIVFTGLVALLLMAIGMGLTTSLFAMFTVFSRNSIVKIAGPYQTIYTVAHTFLSFLGAILITLLGIALLVS